MSTATAKFNDVYAGINERIGPLLNKTAPLKEADGTFIGDSTCLQRCAILTACLYYTGDHRADPKLGDPV